MFVGGRDETSLTIARKSTCYWRAGWWTM